MKTGGAMTEMREPMVGIALFLLGKCDFERKFSCEERHEERTNV